MSAAAGLVSPPDSVRGSFRPPARLSCRQAGAYRLYHATCPNFLLQGVTQGHVSSLYTRACRRQSICLCMISDRQDGGTADSGILALLNLVNDSAKWFVTIAAGSVLLWHHNIDVSWCLLGSIIAVFVCKVGCLLTPCCEQGPCHYVIVLSR